ncbi:MAG TPA: hypothetical protein ENK57_17475, partial [Polyangiaceae bacterium]|nr:hypothetical protein [Polyangiaceae bacterium]
SYALNGTPLREFLRQNPGALAAAGGQAEQDAVAAELPILERLYRIAPRGVRFETMRDLLAAGFVSATQIQSMGRTRFLQEVSGTVDAVVAERIFRKARALSGTALMLRMRHGSTEPTPGMAVLPIVSAGRPEGSSDIIGWEELFGGRTFCACDKCQSSTGPAAYLADLLFWLDTRATGASFLDVLRARRPDLEALELSCKNANTALPTIDLVLEALEATVEPIGASSSRQTTLTEEELAARPEHVHQGAYDRLAGKGDPPVFYPFDQPYLASLDHLRAFVAALGADRSVLQLLLFDGGVVQGLRSPEVAAELLRVNRTSWSILAGDLGAPTNERFGVADVDELRPVRAMLRQAADRAAEQPMSYAELEELLRSRYVQDVPGGANLGALGVWFFNRVCDVGTAELIPSSGAVFDGHADRLSRLIRLSRDLGWSIRDTDRAIEVFRRSASGTPLVETDVSASLLLSLGAVRWLEQVFGRSGPSLLHWWGTLDTRRWAERMTDGVPAGLPGGTDTSAGSGRVARLASANAGDANAEPSPFQRMVGHIPSADLFAVTDDGTALADETQRIDEHLDAVAAVVGVETGELTVLVDALQSDVYRTGPDGTMEGSETMTRAVMFRLDETPTEPNFIFSAHPTATKGWALLVNASGKLIWRVHGTANNLKSAHLTLGQTYVAVATYDGAELTLRVNGEVVASKPFTGPIGASAGGINIGAKRANGARRADALSIFGCAASDSVVLGDVGGYVEMCLARGALQPFTGVEHLYIASRGITLDQVGDFDLTTKANITLATLSELRRHAELGEALGLGPRELVGRTRWLGLEPFGTPFDTVAFVVEAERQGSVSVSPEVLDALLADPGERDVTVFGVVSAGEAFLALSDEVRAHAVVEGAVPDIAERDRAVVRRLSALLNVEVAIVDAFLDGMHHEATVLRQAVLDAAVDVAAARGAAPVDEADPETLTTRFDAAIWETVAIAGWLARAFDLRLEDMSWLVGDSAKLRSELLPSAVAWVPDPDATVVVGQSDPAGGTDAVEITDASASVISAGTIDAAGYEGQAVVGKLWIQKDAAADHFVGLRLRYDGSSAELGLNLATGEVDVPAHGFDAVEVHEESGWWVVGVFHAGDLRSSTLALEISPARGFAASFPAKDASASGSVRVFAPSVRRAFEWEGLAFGVDAARRYASWALFREAARLQSAFSGEGRLFDLLGQAVDGSILTAAELRGQLAIRTGWSEEDLAAAIDDDFGGPLGGASALDWAEPERLTRLAGWLEQAKTLRVPAAKLASWGALAWRDDGLFDDPVDLYQAQAAEVEETLRAVWGAERWLKQAPKVRDALRERQRNALVSKAAGGRFTSATQGLSASDYLSHPGGELDGSESMTRVVVFRLDAVPAADSFLFSANPTTSSGWGLFVNPSGQLVWQVHDAANAIASSPLAVGQTHVAVATYDGAAVALRLDGEVVAPKALTGAVGAGTNGVAIGAQDASGAGPASTASIVGCAASDSATITNAGSYIDACLLRGDVLPFDGVEHLYSAKLGLDVDRLGSAHFTTHGAPQTRIVKSSTYSADRLAQDLLMDLQTGGCARTSRLVDATRTVQLFVQRILTGQEGVLGLTEEEADEWRWRKSFRVWEANRKVFLYPENWLRPELRRDKTPLFEQLESDLAQGSLTDEAVEAAYRTYLRSLATVSKLEAVTMVREEREEGEDIIHVFARTRGMPQTFYHRKWSDGAKWSPWRQVASAGVEGEHLFPVFYQRRLMLFWLTVSETAQEPTEVATPEADERVDTSDRYFHINLTWSEFRDERWAPPTRSDAFIGVDPRGQRSPPGLALEALIASANSGEARSTLPATVIHGHIQEAANGRDLLIQLFRDGPESGSIKILPRFRVNGVDGSISTEEGQRFGLHAAAPYQAEGQPYAGVAQRFLGQNRLVVPFRHPQAGHIGQPVLTARPDPAASFVPLWLTPLSRAHFNSRDPFVFEDPSASYWVTYSHQLLYIDPANMSIDADVAFHLPLDPPTQKKRWRDAVQIAVRKKGSDSETGVSGLVANRFLREAGATGHKVVSALGEPLTLAATKYGMQMRVQILDEDTQSLVYEARSGGDDTVDETLQLDFVFFIPPTIFQGELTEGVHVFRANTAFFRFQSFSHPHVAAMRAALNRGGVFRLLRPEPTDPLFGQDPAPPSRLDTRHDLFGVVDPLPKDDLDFEPTGAYSQYNWELFFHAPFLVATRLHEAGRFQDALDWLHTIFDPSRPAAAGATDAEIAQSAWKFRPFREQFAVGGATPRNILELLALLTADASDAEALERARGLLQQIADWRRNPFDPHAIARVRVQTYMAAVAMRYLEVLIDWGDQLFAQGTRESVAEATELYLLAARILGARPEPVDVAQAPVRTFAQLLDDFRAGIGPVETLEEAITDVFEVLEHDLAEEADSLPALMYFCTPPNPELLSRFWDRVADRLLKIRSCLDIEGQRRELALFAPPIDPALLVRAVAAGVDLQTLLSDVSVGAPPHRRYAALADLAGALAANAQSLGQSLLTAIEKRDADQLSLLRTTHERALQEDTIELRRQQVAE